MSVLADKTVEIEEKQGNLSHCNVATGSSLYANTSGMWAAADITAQSTTEEAYRYTRSIKLTFPANQPNKSMTFLSCVTGAAGHHPVKPGQPYSTYVVVKGSAGQQVNFLAVEYNIISTTMLTMTRLNEVPYTLTGGWDKITFSGTPAAGTTGVFLGLRNPSSSGLTVYVGELCYKLADNNFSWEYPSIAYEDTAYWPKRKLLTADFPKKNILKPHHALPTSTTGYTSPPWAPLTFDPNDKVMGYGSLKSTCDGTNYYQFIHLTPAFPVTNGDTVTLKAWVKGSPYSGHYIRGAIRCHRITGGYTDLDQLGIPCDGTWKEVSFTKTIPEGTRLIDFFFDRPTAYTNTTLHLNVAQLEISSTPTEYQDPTLDTITQPINKLGEFNEPTTGTDTQTINTKIDIPEITETTTNQTIKTANNILEDINILDVFDRSFIFKDSRLFLHTQNGDGVIRFWRRRLDD